MKIGLGIGIPFIRNYVSSIVFDPSKLFTGSTNGAWYDPSDITTLYRDAAGTLPVTSVEQPVGLMKDKSGRNNHAFNSSGNSANFPVLSARYNLLTKTEQFDDAVWTKHNMLPFGSGSIANTTETTDPIGGNTADKLVPDATNGPHRAYQVSGTASKKMSFRVKPAGYYKVAIVGASTGSYASFNLQTQSVLDSFQVVAGSPSVVSIGNGWYEISVVLNGSDNYQSVNILPNSYVSGDPYATNAFSGDGTSGIYVWGADLRVANDALNQPAYQRVNTATDYDTVGFKPYLRFNGTNQWLQTNSIDFTYTDKMFVSAGVRKLSDATTVGIVSELSEAEANNRGSFNIYYPGSGNTRYDIAVNGTARNVGWYSSYVAPVSTVITSSLTTTATNTAAAIAARFNGAANAGVASTSNASSGNFNNYPLYIGARAGSSLRFNGRLYSLIVAGKLANAVEITETEKYVNGKTAAY